MRTSQTCDLQKAIRGAEKGENTIVKGESCLSHENWVKVIPGSNAGAKCSTDRPVSSPPKQQLWPCLEIRSTAAMTTVLWSVLLQEQ